MADLFPGLATGPADSQAIYGDYIADEAVTIGSPVIIVAAGTGELKPRVEPNNTQGARAFGVAVGGDDKTAVYGGSNETVAVAGEAVQVVTHGLCKVRVNGSTGAISIGSKLTIDAADGVAEIASAGDEVFGIAMQASSADGDFILCFVNPEGIV